MQYTARPLYMSMHDRNLYVIREHYAQAAAAAQIMCSRTQSSLVCINARNTAIILRLVCPQLPGGDSPQELHHSLVQVQLVQKHQHVLPGVAWPANALQHVLHQSSAQIVSPARVARRLAETSLTLGSCDCSSSAAHKLCRLNPLTCLA